MPDPTNDAGPAEDKALMLRFQEQGDYSAFQRLFERHKDPLYAFLVRLSGNETIAEDLSQQTWLKLIEIGRQGAYVGAFGASFKTYLYTLGRNKYIDEYHRKHEATRVQSLDELGERFAAADDRSAAMPERAANRRAMAELLQAAIQTLPLEQREVIAMWANGVALKTVAQITGVSWHTVLSRKKYGLKKLREKLKQYGVAEGDR